MLCGCGLNFLQSAPNCCCSSEVREDIASAISGLATPQDIADALDAAGFATPQDIQDAVAGLATPEDIALGLPVPKNDKTSKTSIIP